MAAADQGWCFIVYDLESCCGATACTVGPYLVQSTAANRGTRNMLNVLDCDLESQATALSRAAEQVRQIRRPPDQCCCMLPEEPADAILEVLNSKLFPRFALIISFFAASACINVGRIRS